MMKILSAVIFTGIVCLVLSMACDYTDMYTFAKNGPKPEKAFIFMCDGPFNGDMGGRGNIDQLCRNKYESQYTFLKAFAVKGFISVSSNDQIRDLMPSVYWDTPVYGIHDI